MAEQTNNRQLFLGEAEVLIEKIRNSLCAQVPTLLLLADSIQAVTSLKKVATDAGVDSLRSIADRLEVVLLRHSVAQTIPGRIELETARLAVDWLAQLAILYGEDLPEPKSLVAELLYTFDLVERSQGAVSLAGTGEQGTPLQVDPFSEDPGFDVGERPVPSHHDPFADDPGFGLEFDLLQRTINFVVGAKNIDDDPFSADPSVDAESDENQKNITASASSDPPYDFFAADPPFLDEPDNR